MRNLGSAAAKGASVTLAAQGARFVLQAASLVVLSRLLTARDFGLVAMVTAIIGVAEIIRDFGLSSAAIQAKTLSDAERTNLFWVNTGIGTVCAAIATGASPLIAKFYGAPQLVPIVLALGWLFLVSGANTQFRAELSRELRFRALAVTDISAQALGITVAIVAASLGAGYWAIVLQQIVMTCTTLVANAAQAKWRPGLFRRSVPLGRFFKYGTALLGMQTMGYATNNVDNLAIGAYWGASSLGFYGRAYQLLIVPLNQVSSALTRVVLPVMSRVQDEPERYDRYVARAQLICLYLFGTGFAVAAGLSIPLVDVIFGGKWSAVAPIFAVLAAGGVFRGFAQLTYWICLSKGLTGMQLRVYTFMRPVMIALILAGLPWGPVGVAFGHTAAFIADWAVSIWWIGRKSGISTKPLALKALRSVVVVSAPMGVLAWAAGLLVRNPAAQLGLGIAAAAVFLGLVALLSPQERRDFRLVVDIVIRAVGRGPRKPRRPRRHAAGSPDSPDEPSQPALSTLK